MVLNFPYEEKDSTKKICGPFAGFAWWYFGTWHLNIQDAGFEPRNQKLQKEK